MKTARVYPRLYAIFLATLILLLLLVSVLFVVFRFHSQEQSKLELDARSRFLSQEEFKMDAMMKRLIELSTNKLPIEGYDSAGIVEIDTIDMLGSVEMAAEVLQGLVSHIRQHCDFTSYHLLIALRRTRRDAYNNISPKVRAAILCSTLKEVRFSNDWREPILPTEEPREAEQALLEIGKPAIPYLLPILDDRRLFEYGDPEGELDCDYRRSDYAHRYICWILGQPYEFEVDFKERDAQIEALKRKLKDLVEEQPPDN